MRPEFDRGVYNLGTVCYAAASTMQSELAGRNAGQQLASHSAHATEHAACVNLPRIFGIHHGYLTAMGLCVSLQGRQRSSIHIAGPGSITNRATLSQQLRRPLSRHR